MSNADSHKSPQIQFRQTRAYLTQSMDVEKLQM